MNCSKLRYVLFRSWQSRFPFAYAASMHTAIRIATNEVEHGFTAVIYDTVTDEKLA